VARALFTDRHKQTGVLCGLLHKKMRPYEMRIKDAHPNQLAAAMAEVEAEIALQLQSCHRSLIILDDIERLHSSFLNFLQGPLHEHYPVASYRNQDGIRKEVSTRDAIFILISDLNEDRLSPELDRKTAIEYIRSKAKQRWGDLKVVNFIQRTVPFVPLSHDELKQVAESTLLHLEEVLIEYSSGRWKGKLTWKSQVVENVVRVAQAERAGENARGVVTWVEVEVKDRLLEAWEEEHGRETQDTDTNTPKGFVFSSFNLNINVDGHVRIEKYGHNQLHSETHFKSKPKDL